VSTSEEGLARSVHVRLVRHAHAIGVDPNLVLTRYGVERFMYRLSRSSHAEPFVLKGALLLLFLASIVDITVVGPIVWSFVGGMSCLIVALLCLLREIYLATMKMPVRR
jgi:hypothetical protein